MRGRDRSGATGGNAEGAWYTSHLARKQRNCHSDGGYAQPRRDPRGNAGRASCALGRRGPARHATALPLEPHFEDRLFAVGRDRVQIKSVRRSNPLYGSTY